MHRNALEALTILPVTGHKMIPLPYCGSSAYFLHQWSRKLCRSENTKCLTRTNTPLGFGKSALKSKTRTCQHSIYWLAFPIQVFDLQLGGFKISHFFTQSWSIGHPDLDLLPEMLQQFHYLVYRHNSKLNINIMETLL